MAKVSELDKAYRARLAAEVARIETQLAFNPTMDPALRMALTRYLDDANEQIQHLDEEEKVALAEKRLAETRDLVLAAALREHELTAAEQRQYSEFLGKEFFTRADFGKLEEFYRSAWGRLSEEGKAEMSHRVWEGVRRKEYEFSELPDIVKEKEAQRLHDQLSMRELPRDLQRIPQSDRDDFTNAWDRGDRSAAFKVLDRPSFAENVALTPKSYGEAAAVVEGKVAKKASDSEMKDGVSVSKTTGNAAGASEINLGDVMLVNNDSGQVAKPLINAPSEAAPGLKR